MSTFIAFIQHSTGNPNQSNREEKEVQGFDTGKEVRSSLFAKDMILHVEKPK